MAARTIGEAVARPIAPRAVRIKVEPRTQNMRESRAILRHLKTYGNLVSFRNLQYDPVNPAPHRMLAVFDSEHAAERLLAESPLQLEVDAPPAPSPVGSPASFSLPEAAAAEASRRAAARAAARATDGPPASAEDDAYGDADAPAAPAPRTFVLVAHASTQDHRATTQRRAQYWGYGAGRGRFASDALAAHVPEPGYSVLGDDGSTVLARIVRRNLDAVAARPGVRELVRRRWERERAAEAAGEDAGGASP